MRRSTPNGRESFARMATRAFAALLCLGLLSVTFLASVFVETRSHHEHDRSGPNGRCAVCLQTAIAQQLTRRSSVAPTAAHPLIASLIACAVIACTGRPFAALATPVSLKIRLND